MKNRWAVQTENGVHTADVVWCAVEEGFRKKSAAIVLNTDTKAALDILASGMFYMTGPDMHKSVLFRIDSCNRARIEGCMFIKASETVDIIRMKENNILREMRELLELDLNEPIENYAKPIHHNSVAS